MRLATVMTASGPRLHLRGQSGYVDVGSATGDERYAQLANVLEDGDAALDAIAGVGETPESRSTSPTWRPPCPRRGACSVSG